MEISRREFVRHEGKGERSGGSGGEFADGGRRAEQSRGAATFAATFATQEQGWLRMGLALGAPQNQGWKEQSRTPCPLPCASHQGITEG